MSKDYREKFEEHRQSIEVDKPNSRMTRSKRHSVTTTKKRKFPLMTFLTVILIFIPLLFLIYVWGFYSPDETEVVKNHDSGSVVQLEKNNIVSASNNDKDEPVVDDDEEKKSDEKQTEAEAYQAAKAKKAAEEAAKIAAQKEKEKAEAEKARELEKQAEKEKQQQEEQKEKKVHTVGANENLFRIALKYYNGDPNGVQKIKDANNLSSDSISVGQQLIIP